MTAPLLDVRGLTAGYGNKTVVRDVSFCVAPGQVLTLLGHNGCGKTTTLKSVLGLNDRAHGEVWLGGERIDALPVSARVGRGLRLLPEGRGISYAISVMASRSCSASPGCSPAALICCCLTSPPPVSARRRWRA